MKMYLLNKQTIHGYEQDIEDSLQEPIKNFLMGNLLVTDLQISCNDLKTGYQDGGPNNGCQGDMLYWIAPETSTASHFKTVYWKANSILTHGILF